MRNRRHPNMHPQLQAIVDELAEADRRLLALVATVPSERWPERAVPNHWSVAECVAHLSLTSQAFLPRLRAALEEGRSLGLPAPEAYKHDVVGGFLWRNMGPPVRVKVRAPVGFVPGATAPAGELVAEFQRLQAEAVACLAEADGLPLSRLRVSSAFAERVRYSVYSALCILPRHQHRHLWQAEQVWARLEGGAEVA